MQEQQPSMLKSALNYGAILGLVLVALTMIPFLMDDYENKIFQYISYIVMIGGLYWSIKSYRDKERGGLISYGNALGFGVLVSVGFAILTAVFSYLYLKFVDDTMLQYVAEESRRQMEERGGMSDAEMDQAMSFASSFASAGFIGFMAFLANVIIGFIISLVLAFVLKKESESF